MKGAAMGHGWADWVSSRRLTCTRSLRVVKNHSKLFSVHIKYVLVSVSLCIFGMGIYSHCTVTYKCLETWILIDVNASQQCINKQNKQPNNFFADIHNKNIVQLINEWSMVVLFGQETSRQECIITIRWRQCLHNNTNNKKYDVIHYNEW